MRSRYPRPGARINATPEAPSATPRVPVHAPATPIAGASVCCARTRLGAPPPGNGTRTIWIPPADAATATYVLSRLLEIHVRSRAYGAPQVEASATEPRRVNVT